MSRADLAQKLTLILYFNVKQIHKRILPLRVGWFFISAALIIPGCEQNHTLVDPFGMAQLELRLVFPIQEGTSLNDPENSNKSSSLQAKVGTWARQGIDSVNVTVIDSVTRDLVLGQRLDIIQTSSGSVAEGVLSIPVSLSQQIFAIAVIVSGTANFNVVGAGFEYVALSPGEIRDKPLEIEIRRFVAVIGEGSVSASSVFSQGFEPEFGVDGQEETSWFSAGPIVDGNTSTYTWLGQQDNTFFMIALLNNSMHAAPQFRSGFGFETVTAQVLDSGDTVQFEQTVAYPKTAQEPVIFILPLVTGRTVRLLLRGHEDPTCGGFGEINLFALRPF